MNTLYVQCVIVNHTCALSTNIPQIRNLVELVPRKNGAFNHSPFTIVGGNFRLMIRSQNLGKSLCGQVSTKVMLSHPILGVANVETLEGAGLSSVTSYTQAPFIGTTISLAPNGK